MGNFKESIEKYNQAREKSTLLKDTLNLITVHNKIGKHYETLGNYPKALEAYLASENWY
ncbi:MAG: tetratricopeptide repeat protein [Bacteroidales bacterium]|nr:tetratricopeptide repeat protein [Bacteroidales bacterium]